MLLNVFKAYFVESTKKCIALGKPFADIIVLNKLKYFKVLINVPLFKYI